MNADQHMPEQAPPPEDHLVDEPAVSLSEALGSGANALVLTDRHGTIRRVASPAPRASFRVSRDLPGRHISAPFAEDERPFVDGLLNKVGGTGFFAMGSIPVRLQGNPDTTVYLSVSTLSAPKSDHILIAWRFTPSQQFGSPDLDARERKLLQRIEVLESRAEAHRNGAIQSRHALTAMVANNRSLSRALRSSRELRDQHSTILRETIEDRDRAVQRLRELNDTTLEVRRNAEDARQRLAFMAELSWVLSETLDPDTTLQRLADQLVPGVTDCCVVDLVDSTTDTLRHAAVTCRDAATAERIGQYPECAYLRADVGHPLRRAMVTGHAVVIHNLQEAQPYAVPDPPSFLDQAAEIGISTCIVLPLRSRDRNLGTLTLASSRPAHRFRPEDLRFAEDIALRAAQALDNAQLFQQAEEASKIRERYLSMASHELRSPLTVVTGFGSLLLRNLESPEPDMEKIATIGHEMRVGLNRLEMLTDNLLVSASLDGQPYEIPRRPVDLVQLIRRVIDREVVSHDGVGIDRITVHGPDELVGVWNGESIERAVANVISNALKYSADEDPVDVILEQDDGWAVIHVHDRGIGMTDREREELFTPFVRGRKARETANGTGLGLYITNQIIERHSGSIDVESEPGAGSTISLRLPLVT